MSDSEFAVAPRTRLFVAPHAAGLVAAERLGQGLEIGGDMTGERRGQVIAQAHPLLVIVLEREHAFIGTVHIRQELAQRVGIFEGRRLQRIEAVAFIDAADGRQHLLLGHDLGGTAVAEAAR